MSTSTQMSQTTVKGGGEVGKTRNPGTTHRAADAADAADADAAPGGGGGPGPGPGPGPGVVVVVNEARRRKRQPMMIVPWNSMASGAKNTLSLWGGWGWGWGCGMRARAGRAVEQSASAPERKGGLGIS
eukprot:TRINITY_DN71423_c0_g1_i1.p3 TRINITY_DN71423_c0_g1~~TRINITY_DN71423_c0_g1_i1.p3  ORF type:complete len:129 (+),score=5.75 TRINITY_DN71423_c0_g1_i1:215-601(+)